MRKIIYHVATTLDGFIAHEDGTTEGFIPAGGHLDEYLEDLKKYDTVVMGRKTYEFGYAFGMKKGDNPYTHAKTYVFSKSLHLPKKKQDLFIIEKGSIDKILTLKSENGSNIYLCGGGDFAGFLLKNKLIDELWLKLNPIIFGKGINLFGDTNHIFNLSLLSSKRYTSGVILLKYAIQY